jgi:Dolichyl-phosphate-mannose-protein mannosyltransferase
VTSAPSRPIEDSLRWWVVRFSLIGLGAILVALCFRTRVDADGIGYYSYLPALAIDHTFNLGPTFAQFLAIHTPVYASNLQHHLADGLTADYKPVGSAELALPFYLLVHLALLLVPGPQEPTVGVEYQFAFTAASLFFAVVALTLIFRFVRRLWGLWPAALATTAVTFGTPLAPYIFLEPSYNHTFSVFSVTAFALYVYATHDRRKPHQWLLAGFLGGLATITHVQEVLFLGLILGEAIYLVLRREWSARLLPGYAIFGAGAVLGGMPQLIADKVIFGRWLPVSAPDITLNYRQLHLFDVLFSTHHGWLSWSPLVVVALLGLPAVVRRLGWFGGSLIAIAVADVILNAALSDWWAGWSFGSRRLTDQTLLLALGFGSVFEWLHARRADRIAVGLLSAGVVWSALVVAQASYVIRSDTGPPPLQFLLGQIQAIPYVPHLFVQGTVVQELWAGQWLPGLFTWLLLATTAAGAAQLILGHSLVRLPPRALAERTLDRRQLASHGARQEGPGRS